MEEKLGSGCGFYEVGLFFVCISFVFINKFVGINYLGVCLLKLEMYFLIFCNRCIF